MAVQPCQAILDHPLGKSLMIIDASVANGPENVGCRVLEF